MQTAQIKLGEDYAYDRGHDVVRMRVQEIITRKSYDKTTSTIAGIIFHDDVEDTRERVEVSPKDVIGRFDEHQRLVAKREAAEAERQRERNEKKTVQENAVQMLADAIGAQAVMQRYDYSDRNRKFKKWDHNDAAVIVDGDNAIEINEHAFPLLLQFLARTTIRMVEELETQPPQTGGITMKSVMAQWERERKERELDAQINDANLVAQITNPAGE